MTLQILSHPFSTITEEELWKVLKTRTEQKQKTQLAFANPEHVLMFQNNKKLQDYTNSCDYVLPDGIGIVWASMLLTKKNNGITLKKRITGTDFALKLPYFCEQNNLSLSILGGSTATTQTLHKNYSKKHPKLNLLLIPGYGADLESAPEVLKEFSPDVLMVCLGNPKQEQWILKHSSALHSLITFGNGGAVDFLAGSKKRAPDYLQKIGLEWVWRFFQDLSYTRLVRIFRVPLFMWFVFLEWIRN